jgi:hypothetical protein
MANRGRPRQEATGVNDAAEFLYSIIEEFKPADEGVAKLLKEATTLLDVSVSLLIDAMARNRAVAAR